MPSLPKIVRAVNGALPDQRGRTEGPGPDGAGGARSWRDRRRYWGRLAPLLVVLAAGVHGPAFSCAVWNPDEGFVAVQARLLAHGGRLYDTVVDRKPPLLPWLYQGGFALFGDGSLWPVRAAAVAAHVVTAVLLASVARRRWGDRWGVAAGVGYVLLSVGLAPEDTQAANFEVFMLPWTAAAFWCADRCRWGLAGLAVAGAALTKQTGAVVLLPVAWMLWRAARGVPPGGAASAVSAGSTPPLCPAPGTARRPGPTAAWAWARLVTGAVLPVLGVAAALGIGRFVFWTVTGSGTYLSPTGAWLVAAGRGLGNAGILAAAGAGLVVPALVLVVRRRRFADGDMTLWLAGSAAAVIAGFQFYGHYYLQLVPPLVLVGTAALRELPHWWKAAAAWTALAAGAFTAWGLMAPRAELEHAQAVAAAVRAYTAPDRTVLVWGMHPEQYWLADRAPATRYLTAGFLTNFSGGRGGARVGEKYAVPGAWRTFQRELARRPPALVVDDSRGAPYAPEQVPTLSELLAERYRRIGTVDGAVLYVLADGRAGTVRRITGAADGGTTAATAGAGTTAAPTSALPPPPRGRSPVP